MGVTVLRTRVDKGLEEQADLQDGNSKRETISSNPRMLNFNENRLQNVTTLYPLRNNRMPSLLQSSEKVTFMLCSLENPMTKFYTTSTLDNLSTAVNLLRRVYLVMRDLV
jgi:hypothetical protein